MPTRKKDFDQTAYFHFLQECVQHSDSSIDGEEFKALIKKYFHEKELPYFNISELKKELFHSKNENVRTGKGSGITTYFTLKFEALYKYVEMVELKEARIAAKRATNLSIAAIIIAAASWLIALVSMLINSYQ